MQTHVHHPTAPHQWAQPISAKLHPLLALARATESWKKHKKKVVGSGVVCLKLRRELRPMITRSVSVKDHSWVTLQ